MTKKKVKITNKKPVITLRNDTVENDDWMKTLPGYKEEITIHQELESNIKNLSDPDATKNA